MADRAIGHAQSQGAYAALRKTFRPKPQCSCFTQRKPLRQGSLSVLNASAAQQHEAESTNKVLRGRTPQSPFHTGSTDVTTAGAAPLVGKPLVQEKQIFLVRHGLTTWNEQKRIQGDSDEAVLTDFGKDQAIRCREALSQIPFDSCFSSPIQRGRQFADLVWADREGPLVELDTLKEAHLGWLQGMRQVDAAAHHEEVFRGWRENPSEFSIGGRHPVAEVFAAARSAWEEMLLAPGSVHLVVTHKSILRALLCVALGLPPIAFRAIDVQNGGVCVFRVNKRAEPMLINMNLTAHMHTDGVYY